MGDEANAITNDETIRLMIVLVHGMFWPLVSRIPSLLWPHGYPTGIRASRILPLALMMTRSAAIVLLAGVVALARPLM